MDVRCILPARAALAEGALWSPEENKLYWVDQMRPEIHRFDPVTAMDTRLPLDFPQQLGALVPRLSGGLVLAASDGISLIDKGLRKREPYVNPIASLPRATFNDAKCDRQGRLWAGTTDQLETESLGCLYRIDRGKSVNPVAEGFICSNGPSFSPDGRIMYHTQTHDRTIYAYNIDPETGETSSRRIFARIDAGAGAPDGSTVDAEGFVWSTHWGGWRVTRYAPDGRIDRVIEMPVKSPTSCTFGGPDMTTLFITSASIELVEGRWLYLDEAGFESSPMAGGLFAIETQVRGIPEPAFRG